jgi:methionyl-tRNA formyltransferase
MTDVPYGRGGSPLQNLIMDGKTETQVTALRMTEEMDAGPVYTKRPMSLEGRAEEIYLRAGAISWDLVLWMIANKPKPIPQKGEVTLFRRRKCEQSEFPLQGELEGVYDHIRMLDAPTYPLVFIKHGSFHLEFHHADLQGDELRACVVIRKEHKRANLS